MPFSFGSSGAPLRSFWDLSAKSFLTCSIPRRLQLGPITASTHREENGKPVNAADALTKTLSGISQTSGRVAQTRNFVLSPDNTEETWRALDEAVNTYPGLRTFKAIGVGGSGFVKAMVEAVEGVIGAPVHEECVQERPSSKGSYISVTVGPVLLQDSDQVVKIYAAMKEDERLKWYM